MKIRYFILSLWLLVLLSFAKSNDKCKICKDFSESFKKVRTFMFILIDDHPCGRNLIILQSQIMLVVTRHGKKRNWVPMLTGTNLVILYAHYD